MADSTWKKDTKTTSKYKALIQDTPIRPGSCKMQLRTLQVIFKINVETMLLIKQQKAGGPRYVITKIGVGTVSSRYPWWFVLFCSFKRPAWFHSSEKEGWVCRLCSHRLFLIFHLFNMFKRNRKEGMTSPFIGMWLAVLVLTPVGIFLTYKAMHDSQLFNKEYYFPLLLKEQAVFSALLKKIHPLKKQNYGNK